MRWRMVQVIPKLRIGRGAIRGSLADTGPPSIPPARGLERSGVLTHRLVHSQLNAGMAPDMSNCCYPIASKRLVATRQPVTAMATWLHGRGRYLIPRRVQPNMKKLFSLLFAAALAVSLAMPVFAQDSSASSDSSMSSAPKKEKKAKKMKKAKKEKKTDAAPAQ